MKWKRKPPLRDGQVRTRRRFAWLREDIEGDESVWLAHYTEQQQVWFGITGGGEDGPYYGLHWVTMRRWQPKP